MWKEVDFLIRKVKYFLIEIIILNYFFKPQTISIIEELYIVLSYLYLNTFQPKSTLDSLPKHFSKDRTKFC